MSLYRLRPRWILACLSLSALALSCGGGGGSTPSEPPNTGPKTVTIEIRDFSYEPHSVKINPGDTVRWVLKGSDHTHTVTALSGLFDSGAMFNAPDTVYERRFTEDNSTFDYSCKAHSACCNMKGSVLVGASAPPPTPGYE